MTRHSSLPDAVVALLRRWQGRSAAVAVRPEPVVMAPTRRMSGEYLALHTYLDGRYATTVVMTFEQIEALLGFPLPDAARSDSGWWTDGGPAAKSTHADAWRLASRTASPNLSARTVTFERLTA
jgi:hypothetical protein